MNTLQVVLGRPCGFGEQISAQPGGADAPFVNGLGSYGLGPSDIFLTLLADFDQQHNLYTDVAR